jgi:hypothetical protein
VPRQNAKFEICTEHATGRAVGLTRVTDQIAQANSTGSIPLAAINGDFYRRDGPYAGDPRGLQIVETELISAPVGGTSLCVDLVGEPRLTNIESRLQVVWPNGLTTLIGLNENRRDRITLYTPSLGPSTQTSGGREIILSKRSNDSWLPLRPGRTYRARVREIRSSGNTPVPPDAMVLSVSPSAEKTVPWIEPGTELTISTDTEPSIRGVRSAIGGGPQLVRQGKRLRFKASDSDSYEFSTMTERHPRSAVGWNEDYFFLVAVDGRQKGVSEGMTLNELAEYLVELGCQEAMNLDGGGSATLWYDGKVRNYLCDGYEREVANSLVVRRKSEVTRHGTRTLQAGKDRRVP